MDHFVQVHSENPHYFELTNGQPYIPIGINWVTIPSKDRVEELFEKMAENKINFCRLWIGQSYLDVEHEKTGEYDPQHADNIQWFLDLARKHNIRLKLCIEYFRDIPKERSKWSDRPWHHVANGGMFTNIKDFLESKKGIEQFKKKLYWFKERFGNEPAIFGWELWNEMNAVKGMWGEDWIPWTKTMLTELQELFPKNLVMQSLGSFDRNAARDQYRILCHLQNNDVAQVHRYLDTGAQLEVCHGPVDILAADAVRELIAFDCDKPVLLAESGAVEPRHTGSFKLYSKDKDGMILHDVIFAPFFAGAAGTGHTWWWSTYVEENDLWWQFERFSNAVHDIDPAQEAFVPEMIDHNRLRVYVLHGKNTLLMWCRDKQNTWISELKNGESPEWLKDQSIHLSSIYETHGRELIEFYNPWTDKWTKGKMENGNLPLPDFQRSLVIRIKKINKEMNL